MKKILVLGWMVFLLTPGLAMAQEIAKGISPTPFAENGSVLSNTDEKEETPARTIYFQLDDGTTGSTRTTSGGTTSGGTTWVNTSDGRSGMGRTDSYGNTRVLMDDNTEGTTRSTGLGSTSYNFRRSSSTDRDTSNTRINIRDRSKISY